MIVRENSRIKRGSAEFEVIKKQILDLYIITDNATSCYTLYRRTIDGEDYNGNPTNRANASSFFKKEENQAYIEQRKVEIARWGFEQYALMMNLDINEFKQKEDKYSDIENLTPDELRTKNLAELESIKERTNDDNLKANIIKQQTDLMDAKRKGEEEQSTEKFIHFYLPMEYCNGCPIRPNKNDKKTEI